MKDMACHLGADEASPRRSARRKLPNGSARTDHIFSCDHIAIITLVPCNQRVPAPFQFLFRSAHICFHTRSYHPCPPLLRRSSRTAARQTKRIATYLVFPPLLPSRPHKRGISHQSASGGRMHTIRLVAGQQHCNSRTATPPERRTVRRPEAG